MPHSWKDEHDKIKIENDRLRATLHEIANRAANMADPDAAEWMPSIYKIACEATGEDPSSLLRAAGHSPDSLTYHATRITEGTRREEARNQKARLPEHY